MEKQNQVNTPQQEPEKKKTGKIILIIAIIVAVFILLGVIVAGVMKDRKEDAVPVSQPVEEETIVYGDEYYGIDAGVDEQLQDYRNVVLLGVDTKSIETDEGHRSDGMIVCSFHKKTGDVKVFSVYRDTYLDIDETHGLDKVTHGYAYGGMDESIRALNRNLDLNIREAIVFSWNSVSHLVNSIGGVDIEIRDSEVSQFNKLLENEEDRISSGGKYTLNGAQAVAYCRMRYDSSDFRRNERMQTVLITALNQAKEMSAARLLNIMDDNIDNIKSNMSKGTMTETLMEIADYEVKDSNICFPFDTKGWMHNEIYYGVPVTLHTNVAELHEKIFGQADYQPSEFVEKTSAEIESRSGYTKSAGNPEESGNE